MVYFGISSLENHDVLKKCSLSRVAFLVDESQAYFAASAFVVNPDHYGDDLDLKGAVSLHDLEWISAKHCLDNFQDSSRVKMRKVSGTVAEVFKVATELVDPNVPVDDGQ